MIVSISTSIWIHMAIYGVQPVATLRLHRRVRSCTKNGGQVTGSGDWYVWQNTQQQNTSYCQPWLFLIFTWYVLSRNWVFQCSFGRLIIDPHFLIFSHWNSHRLNGIQPISEDKPDFHGCEHGSVPRESPADWDPWEGVSSARPAAWQQSMGRIDACVRLWNKIEDTPTRS